MPRAHEQAGMVTVDDDEREMALQLAESSRVAATRSPS